MANVIRCDHYDHFEIACMRRETVELQMFDGEHVRGTAIDLQTKGGREWLFVNLESGERRTADLREIKVLVFPKSGQSIKITED